MKKKNLFSRGCIMLLCTVSIINCSKKNDQEKRDQEGMLNLTVISSGSDKMIINTLRSVPVNQYKVLIMNAEHEIYEEFEHYEDVPASVTLEAGDYYVVAHSGNDSTAAFENPYFYGKSDLFTIGAGQVTSVDVACSVMNCAVRISYSENIQNSFSDYYTVVKVSKDSLIFGQTETRGGYFNIQPVTVYSVLTYELSNETTAKKRINGFIENPEPGNLYEITIDASIDNMQTGILLSINDLLDTNLIELNDQLSINDLTEGDLLISEIMYDPSALSDTYGEWFEVYNNVSSPVNLYHLVIKSEAELFTVDEKIVIQPGEYIAFAKSDTAFEGDKYVYTTISLTNTTDEISLYTYGTDGTDGFVIATVVYNESGGFPDGSGESINLCTSHFNFDDAQLASSWCLSTETYNTGDMGTPGQPNKLCE